MPLARIDLVTGKSADYRRTIADVVYEGIIGPLKAPEGDRFQVITEHPHDGLIVDPNYLGIQRTKDCIFIQVTMNEGRTVEQKKSFFKNVADGLHQRGLDCGARTCSSISSRSERRTGHSAMASRNMPSDSEIRDARSP